MYNWIRDRQNLIQRMRMLCNQNLNYFIWHCRNIYMLRLTINVITNIKRCNFIIRYFDFYGPMFSQYYYSQKILNKKGIEKRKWNSWTFDADTSFQNWNKYRTQRYGFCQWLFLNAQILSGKKCQKVLHEQNVKKTNFQI